jgi:arsenate reductase
VTPVAEVTIFHNPNCSTSRYALEVLDAGDVDHEVVLYLKTAPDAAALRELVDKLEDPPADLVRKDAHFKSLGLDPADYVEAGPVVELLAAHPRLLQRPVLVRGDRAIIGRPKDRVEPFVL